MSRRRLYSDEFRRIVRSVHILAAVQPEPVHDARAVLLVAGEGVFASHHTAARLWGGIVPDDARLHAGIAPEKSRSRVPGVLVHQSKRTSTLRRGVRVTTPADTFADLSACLGLVDLVVLGDSLVRKGRCTPADLMPAASDAPNPRLARAAADLVRANVDSPMETRLRLLVVLAGLPEPEVNIVFHDATGVVARRLDLGYRAAKLALEYDGRQHAESPQQYAVDIRRREEFAAAGWFTVTVVSSDLYRTPGETLRRITEAMRPRGMDVPALRDHWRAHFPGR